MTAGISLIALVVPGFWQLLLILVLVLVLFGGKGKISSVMGDLAKGITSFRKGLQQDDEKAANNASPATKIPDARETVDVTPEHKADAARTEG